jgi:hypothetical protein
VFDKKKEFNSRVHAFFENWLAIAILSFCEPLDLLIQ